MSINEMLQKQWCSNGVLGALAPVPERHLLEGGTLMIKY